MSVWRLTNSSVSTESVNFVVSVSGVSQTFRVIGCSGKTRFAEWRADAVLRSALRIAAAFELCVYEIWETSSPSENDSKNRRRANGPALTVYELRAKRATGRMATYTFSVNSQTDSPT
jgi:hypothetical protein